VFSVPDDTVHRTKVADWLELEAISSPDGRVGFGTLISASALAEEEQPEDMADEDIKDDALVLSAQAEIARRLKNIGHDYPFRIEENGQAMKFATPVSKSVRSTCSAYSSHMPSTAPSCRRGWRRN
jgi:hypothetical protein